MKKKLMITGGCLVAGMLSCSMLVAAVKCTKDEAPMPAAAALSQKAAAPESLAKGSAQAATEPVKEKKRRRARKTSTSNEDGSGAEAPRKRRTRKARRQVDESGNAGNEM